MVVGATRASLAESKAFGPGPPALGLLLYDYGGGNWCGLGADDGGNVWLRTGTSGTPVPVVYVRNDQTVIFPGSPTVQRRQVPDLTHLPDA